MTRRIPVPMDAGRVCDAIAKIGYSPSAAIMDIADNSVTAGANLVTIEIDVDLSGNKTFITKNNVITYRIIDNGKGMTDDDMVDALRLGSKAEYQENSLSKYGMGLKSAGFSLGTKIQIVSKKNGVFGTVNYVDRDEISQMGEYTVSQNEFNEVDTDFYDSKLDGFDSGTVIEISGCQKIEQNSAKKTRNELFDRLGVVYYEFFRKVEDPLSMIIRCINTNESDLKIEPFDILFSEQAKKEGYDPDEYDFQLPILLYKDDVYLPGAEGTPPVSLEVVVFPAAEMANYGEFTKEEKQQIVDYKIKRENKGFFVYRNNRLIRWGDSLGIVGKDNFNFRARVVLNTAHNDAFHIDVSKQRINIPKDILVKIKLLSRNPLRFAAEAVKVCSEAIKLPEGAAFNYRNQNLSDLADEEVTGKENIKIAQERKRYLIMKTQEQEKLEQSVCYASRLRQTLSKTSQRYKSFSLVRLDKISRSAQTAFIINCFRFHFTRLNNKKFNRNHV